ncbi:hypothetical protein [Cytobacillus oceanisediminis]|jgi:hypothetical protein|nr:hypothetical protein [Cytobacillus oceanisediminis]MBU8772157.1 hypothetical protein [Cytobacillus oceanisediminis]
MKENNRASENEQLEKDKEIHFVKELDQEAFDVIQRLYDKTFKELVDR